MRFTWSTAEMLYRSFPISFVKWIQIFPYYKTLFPRGVYCLWPFTCAKSVDFFWESHYCTPFFIHFIGDFFMERIFLRNVVFYALKLFFIIELQSFLFISFNRVHWMLSKMHFILHHWLLCITDVWDWSKIGLMYSFGPLYCQVSDFQNY